MFIVTFKYFLFAIFGLLIFGVLEEGILFWQNRATAVRRLRYVRKAKKEGEMTEWVKKSKILIHIYELLEILSFKITLSRFLYATVIFAISGFAAGTIGLGSQRYGMILMVIGLSIPYVYVRWKLIGYQNSVASDFLSALEVFYETYVSNPSKNIRVVLSVATPLMRYPVREGFEFLQNLLNTRELKEALLLFKRKMGEKWVGEFADVFEVGYTTGLDMSDSIKEIIDEMRERSEEVEADRRRNTEIRFGNIATVFIFIFFFFLAKATIPKWYYYYFEDPLGQRFTMFLTILVFFMFVIGIFMSRKKY